MLLGRETGHLNLFLCIVQEANHRSKVAELRDVRQHIEDTSSVLGVVRAEMADLPNQEQRKLDPEKDLDLVRVSYEWGGIFVDRVKSLLEGFCG